ncbi:hypothetical protein [Shouchella lehensis]|uniref:DUF2612 domain-containing protein n=1 Tax=Shouchella lehensis TaxID=300825 RepID=A0A4Y7WDF1_9BACI|nr:hypothetical protein [Shouchella lehensis]MBG9783595.1 hypothetical protein [Shouchella lehensis]TES45647.1 hypothetical protein E2L03_19895 [Shouchella lehensis]
MVKDLLSKLTDAFTKSEKSNIGKLFLVIDEQLESVKSALIRTEEWRDLNNAKGSTLDEIGVNVNQLRGRANDPVFRVLIRGKIARNVSDGTINKMVNALAKTLNCPHEVIQIVSMIEDNQEEPAAIVVKRAPIEALAAAGLTATQFTNIVQATTMAGVRVAYVDLNGTFRFSTHPTEIEVSEYGFDFGSLGGIFQPEEEIPLPI